MSREFTGEQLEIINYNGSKNIVVNACAGSGKTSVLLERSMKIYQQNKTHKKQLLLTTNNAVKKEIKEKSENLDLEIETFHSFALNEVLPFKNKNQLDINFNRKSNSFSEWVNEFETNNMVNGSPNANFDFLLQYCNSLLTEVNVKNYISAKYSHLYVDECQDNTIYKHIIINLLNDLGLYCMLVGDINQNLYSWAGGKAIYFKEFFEDEHFKIMNLTRNFRCHENIDSFANSCCEAKLFIESTVEEVNYIEESEVEGLISSIDSLRVFRRSGANCKLFADEKNVTHIKRPSFTEQFDYEIEIYLHEYFNGKNPHVIVDYLSIEATKKNINKISKSFQNINHVDEELIEIIVGDVESLEIYSEYLKNAIVDIDVQNYFTASSKAVSTIHASKGLEYDNVLIYQIDYNNLHNEDTKSLLYVACTRAKKKLYIVE